MLAEKHSTAVARKEKLSRLKKIAKELNSIQSYMNALPLLEQAARGVFNADRITLYRRDARSSDIVSVLKSGTEVSEIRVPVSLTSIAGFTAFSRKPLCINDVRDSAELKAAHAGLRFNAQFDQTSGYRTESVISVPIQSRDTLLGVLQLVNKRQDKFNQEDLRYASAFAQMIGDAFHHQLSATSSPFQLLLEHGHLTAEQLKVAQLNAEVDDRAVTDLLQSRHKVSKQNIGESLEAFYQVPWLSFSPERFSTHPISAKINKAYLTRNQMVLLQDKESDSVYVVIDDPNDTNRVLLIERFVGALQTKLCVALPEDIRSYQSLDTDYSEGEQQNLSSLLDELETKDIEALPDEAEDSDVSDQDSTVVRLVNRILQDGRRFSASDIHIEPGLPGQPAAVRMRIDGVCQEMIQIPASHIRACVSRIKIMSRLDIAERRLPQDGKFAVKIAGARQEVRVATIPTVQGEGVVMRLLHSGEPVGFDQLNLSDHNRQQINKLMGRPNGLFLVVGPTGSGKTTTLHAVLSRLNDSETKIWTAEDPVEITQPGLQQVQVQPNIGFTFAAALRSFLRADPDVILIGEMRDEETANVAVEASLTGHKVLSTLHTNSAPETITRLLDLGVEPVSFADALLGVLAQRLVRRLCPDCKEADQATESEVAYLKSQYGSQFDQDVGLSSGSKLFRAKGCACCNHTGYRGRVAIHELLTTSPELRDQIYHRATVDKVRTEALNSGMRTLMQDGIKKIAEGEIDIDQLHRVAAAY